MSPSEFAVAITTLFEGLGKPLPPPRTLDVWSKLLIHLDAAALRGAVEKFLRSGDDWPNAGKLLKLVDAGPSPEDRARVAYQALRRAIERIGWYGSCTFDDPLVNVVVRDLGGWQAMVDLPDDQWTEKRFCESYGVRLRCGYSPDLAAPLIGELDRLDHGNGYETHEPARIATGLPPVTGLPTLPRAIAPQAPRLPRPEPSSVGEVLATFALPTPAAACLDHAPPPVADSPKVLVPAPPRRSREEQLAALPQMAARGPPR